MGALWRRLPGSLPSALVRTPTPGGVVSMAMASSTSVSAARDIFFKRSHCMASSASLRGKPSRVLNSAQVYSIHASKPQSETCAEKKDGQVVNRCMAAAGRTYLLQCNEVRSVFASRELFQPGCTTPESARQRVSVRLSEPEKLKNIASTYDRPRVPIPKQHV
jgi:hypothetical protein